MDKAVNYYVLLSMCNSVLLIFFRNPSYIRRCLIFLNVRMEEYRKKHYISTFLHTSWERGHVNLILLPNLAGDKS